MNRPHAMAIHMQNSKTAHIVPNVLLKWYVHQMHEHVLGERYQMIDEVDGAAPQSGILTSSLAHSREAMRVCRRATFHGQVFHVHRTAIPLQPEAHLLLSHTISREPHRFQMVPLLTHQIAAFAHLLSRDRRSLDTTQAVWHRGQVTRVLCGCRPVQDPQPPLQPSRVWLSAHSPI
jgi:hypothetical protein